MQATLRRFFRSIIYVFGAVLCMFFLVQDNYSLDKAAARRDLSLNFQLDKTGKTEIFITFLAEPTSVEHLPAALTDSLGCAIQNATLEKIDLQADDDEY